MLHTEYYFLLLHVITLHIPRNAFKEENKTEKSLFNKSIASLFHSLHFYYTIKLVTLFTASN